MANTYLPADWHKHSRCWIGLPSQPELWQQRFQAARQTVVDIANAIIDFEPVNVLCPPGYGNFLGSYTDSRIEIIEAPFHDAGWLRDIAPTYVRTKKGRVRGLFGKSARELPSYTSVKRLLLDKLHLATSATGVSFDNGALTTDGEGTVICTKTSLFGPSKNNDTGQDYIERQFARFLGTDRVIWVPRGLATDPAHGQIINLLRFVAPGIVVLANHGNKNDPNKTIAIDTFDLLEDSGIRDARGRKLAIYQVHNPPPILYHGQRLCCSYTNFYVANEAVIIPGFYKPNYDRNAKALFKELFPKHEIVQVQVFPLLTGGGGIHCVTCPQVMGVAEEIQVHDAAINYG